MATLKTYLTAVVADTGSTAAVYFDTIDSTTNSTGVETLGSQTYAANPTSNRVLVLSAGSGDGVAAKGGIAEKRAVLIDLTDGGSLGLENSSNVSLFSNGTLATTAGSLVINANSTFTIAAIKSVANVARFAAYGITLDAVRGGNSTGIVSLVLFKSGGSSGTADQERYDSGSILDTSNNNSSHATTATNYGVGIDDLFTLTIGGNSATASIGGSHGGAAAGTATTMTAIGTAIRNAWGVKYGAGDTAANSNTAVATFTHSAGVFAITMYDKGTGGYNKNVSISVNAGSVTATSAANISWEVGATASLSDNKTADADVIMLMTSIDAGTALNKVGTVSFMTSSATAGTLGNVLQTEELISTKTVNVADTTLGFTEAQESGRTDVVNAEDGLGAVAESTPAATYSRLGWL